ncbi:MAG: hypothetical protein ACM3ZC_13730 [Bacteroidota bacterium]
MSLSNPLGSPKLVTLSRSLTLVAATKSRHPSWSSFSARSTKAVVIYRSVPT